LFATEELPLVFNLAAYDDSSSCRNLSWQPLMSFCFILNHLGAQNLVQWVM